jgi:hypothetical protein
VASRSRGMAGPNELLRGRAHRFTDRQLHRGNQKVDVMTTGSKRSPSRRKKTAPVDPARVEDITAGLVAEAEKLLGITGPRLTVNVDGQMYRLMSHPETQPAAAAALFAEMVYMIRN